MELKAYFKLLFFGFVYYYICSIKSIKLHSLGHRVRRL